MEPMIITNSKDLKNLVKEAIIEVESEKEKTRQGEKLYTINEVAKRLGKAHGTIKKLCRNGTIRTTKNGYISEAAIEEYLGKQH